MLKIEKIILVQNRNDRFVFIQTKIAKIHFFQIYFTYHFGNDKKKYKKYYKNVIFAFNIIFNCRY